jgi:hypothetical protein
VFCGLAIHWQYAVGVVDRSEPILSFDFGAGAGTRTPDPRFKRPLL